MAGARRAMINGKEVVSRRYPVRRIPKRGQVKVAIVVGLAHSVASIFSQTNSSRRAGASHFSQSS